ncbi:MAG: phosphopyruvate hydratase [bacterium]|nr:phosphopyruvate hydratase [bacterium]
MAKITNIFAHQILDSRGDPTIETTVILDSGIFATASSPSGASTGKHEALELRDHDENDYQGKSVHKAIENVNSVINAALAGKNAENIQDLDASLLQLDNTENKSNLGANAILSVSIALTKVIAFQRGEAAYKYLYETMQSGKPYTMPKPLCNLINGGLHAGWNLDIQEFIVTPLKAPTFAESIKEVVHVAKTLKGMLVAKGFQTLVGDEGGFAPKLATNEEAFALLREAITKAGYQNHDHIALGMDAAASSFYKDGAYVLRDKAAPLSPAELGVYYVGLAQKYDLFYLEDPFEEDEIEAWESFLPTTPQNLIVTGDDLTVTNPKRLDMALEKKAIRGIIIKPNQIGTVTESMEVVKKAKAAGLTVIVSHRSGETTDDFVADFAVGVGADFAKFGAPVRGERVVKYNRLMQIEQELGLNAK